MAHNFSEGQRAEFQAAFDFFDKNGDKQISAKELGVVMKNIGQHITEQELNQMIIEADEDGSGTIDFDEFLMLMSKRLQELDVKEELIEAFRVYDKEKNGCISVDEIRKILQKMGETVSKDEIEEVLKDLDPNESKIFRYEDYVNQVDPFKFTTYGVKKPLDEKTQSIQDLLAQSKRYYPVDRHGNIDEWGAIVSQQLDTYNKSVEQKKLNDKQQAHSYGDELKHEQALKEKQREIERYEKINDLEMANRKKHEYDLMVNQFKTSQMQMQQAVASDYKQHMNLRNYETQSIRMQDLSEGQLANQRVQQEMDQLKQMEFQKKQMIKDIINQDMSDRKQYISYENLIRDQQRQDYMKNNSENSQIALDTQRIYKQRYDQQQEQQKFINENYLKTVKAPLIERSIEEQERVNHQMATMRKQALNTEEQKQYLQREFAVNNKQILEKQLKDHQNIRMLDRVMKDLELKESDMKIQSNKQFEQLKSDVNQQRKMTYKEMLDHQVNVKNQLKIYGNMTNVEKQLNKDDLEAYKNYQSSYNAMIPGLNNFKTLQKDELQLQLQRPNTKNKRDNTEEINLKRLDKYGYNREYATLMNQGSQTARGQPVSQEYFQNRSAVMDMGLQNIQQNFLGDRQSYNASLGKNQSMNQLFNINPSAITVQNNKITNVQMPALTARGESQNYRFQNNPISPIGTVQQYMKPPSTNVMRLF
eukprot:403337038